MSTFTATTVYVGTTAGELVSDLPVGRYQIIIQGVPDHTVWVGDSSVTDGSNGIRLSYPVEGSASEPLVLDVLAGPDDALYAASDAAGVAVTVMVNPR